MVSIIVPICSNNIKWVEILKEQQRCLAKQTFKDFEYIIVEQYKDEMLFNEVPCDLYIPIKSEELCYRLGWMWNVGARSSSGDTLILTGADYVFGVSYLEELVKWYASVPINVCRVGIRVLNISEQKTNEIIGTNYVDSKPFPPRHITGKLFVNGGSGNLILSKDIYWSAGGYSENYYNYGWEDEEFLFRLNFVLGMRIESILPNFDYTLVHLNHPRNNAPDNIRCGHWNFRIREFTRKNTELSVNLHTAAALGKVKHPTIINLSEYGIR